jgi:signal transduction histidine kinase
MGAIAIAHHTTNPAYVWWHVAYQDLCYVPILVSAYWFGTVGAVVVAIVAGVGTALHFHTAWHGNTAFVVSQYGQAIAFVIAGAVGGTLAGSERRATKRYQDALAAAERARGELDASHAQLNRADRLASLGEIAASLAHEIGNPLAGIKGALEIVASRAVPGSPEDEFSALGSREITRLESLIQEFLDYARPREPRRAIVDLFELLERAHALVRREADDRGLSISLSRTEAPVISVDADQILQVLVNVMLNAIQASPSGGLVEIVLQTMGSAVAVDVCDQGQGIAPEHVAKVFDPFFSTKKRGTGLGLSISNRIVHNHGGRIEIVPRARGTLMRVHLPVDGGRSAPAFN